MKDALKIALASSVAVVFGVGALALAGSSLSQGYAVVGKYHARTIAQADSPVAFYLAIASMCALGLVMLGAAALFLFARGSRRAHLVAYLNRNVFAIRPSVRWLLLGAVVLVGALASFAIFRT